MYFHAALIWTYTSKLAVAELETRYHLSWPISICEGLNMTSSLQCTPISSIAMLFMTAFLNGRSTHLTIYSVPWAPTMQTLSSQQRKTLIISLIPLSHSRPAPSSNQFTRNKENNHFTGNQALQLSEDIFYFEFSSPPQTYYISWRQVQPIKNLFLEAGYPQKFIMNAINNFRHSNSSETIISSQWFDDRRKINIWLPFYKANETQAVSS